MEKTRFGSYRITARKVRTDKHAPANDLTFGVAAEDLAASGRIHPAAYPV